MDPFAGKRELLRELYGFEFPDSLFHLHELLGTLKARERRQAEDAMALHPSGLLEVLALPEKRLKALRPKLPMLLHYRYYRDPPEFFTCLHGECDGQHWGLLLDDPKRGFRGAASYYNNDGDVIEVYGGLFDAVLDRIDSLLEEVEERIDDDPDSEAEYRREEERLRRFREQVEAYVGQHGLALDEGRGKGVASDTKLSLIVPPKAAGAAKPPGLHDYDGDGVRIGKAVEKASAACERGSPAVALGLGRSLWYWGGDEWSGPAHRLLRQAYEALGRPRLAQVLDVHYEHRDLPNVDVLGGR
jgi:hypothetical protein